MSEQEYSSAEVARIVQSVLSSEDRELWSYGDARILDIIADLVYENLGPKDYSVFLRELKERVFDHMPNADPMQSLKTLHTIVASCRLCSGVVEDPQMPRWNLEDPDVLLVSTTPLSSDVPGADVLVEGMKSAGLSSSHVAATSVVRCNPLKGTKVGQEVVSTCSTRYLFKEILFLQPKVILTLGSTAYSVLTGGDEKITEVAGNWRHIGPWSILPSYDPSHASRSKGLTEELFQHIALAKQKGLPNER